MEKLRHKEVNNLPRFTLLVHDRAGTYPFVPPSFKIQMVIKKKKIEWKATPTIYDKNNKFFFDILDKK